MDVACLDQLVLAMIISKGTSHEFARDAAAGSTLLGLNCFVSSPANPLWVCVYFHVWDLSPHSPVFIRHIDYPLF